MNTGYSDDRVLACLSVLEAEDVSPARAAQLRRRCHAALSLETIASEPTPQRPAWRGWLATAIGAAWCTAYIVETIRRALALYRAS